MTGHQSNFDPHDLEHCLQVHTISQGGSHDMRRWSVTTGDDATDPKSRMVSMHEFFHHDLNNTTVYGIGLQYFSYILQEKINNDDPQTDILKELVERCRMAHEVYATGLSIMVSMHSLNDSAPETLLKDNVLYYRFFKTAEALVQSLDHIYHKRLALMIAIRTCFQSAKFAESLRSDFYGFDPGIFPFSEFPDERLKILIGLMPSNFWRSTLNNFTLKYGNGEDSINSLEYSKEGGDSLENDDAYGSKLMEWFYDACAELFSKAGMPCIGIHEHLDVSKEIFKQVDRIHPFDQSESPMKINLDPFEYDKLLLQHYEHEKWVFRDELLFCMVIFPQEVGYEFKQTILNGVGNPKHILLMRRERSWFENQYQFDDEIDRQRFAALKDNITFLRITTYENGRPTIVIIPFESPDVAVAFLDNKAENVRLIGCVSLRTLYESTWGSLWKPLFDSFDHSCVLLDTSPLYCIEEIFKSYESVNYEKMVINYSNQKFTAMVFELKDSGATEAVLIAPCTEMHCEIVHNYIRNHYPEKYRLHFDSNQDYKESLANILSRIFREEKHFFFASAPA